MRTIILQHFTGPLREMETVSLRQVSAYAAAMGAEHRLLTGNVFDQRLSPPCQKLAMLGAAFDDYDIVVMMDLDMLPRAGLRDSIFEAPGIGVSTWFQRRLKWAHIRKMSGLVHWRGTYWGGAIWRLTRDHRVRLRAGLGRVDLMRYSNGQLEDEGIMHRLAVLAGIRGEVLPGGERWAHSSYFPDLDTAAFIHVRKRLEPDGPKMEKIDVYRALAARGIVAP